MLPWLMEPWLRSNTYSQWNKNSRSCRWCYCHHQNKGWYFRGPCWSFRTAKRYYCFQWPDKKGHNKSIPISTANFVAFEIVWLHIMQGPLKKWTVICGKISWLFWSHLSHEATKLTMLYICNAISFFLWSVYNSRTMICLQ